MVCYSHATWFPNLFHRVLKMRINYAPGIDTYCNACGRKIKVVDDKKDGENNANSES